jgi:acetyl-CoA carboxylase carboxyltransferase component
MVHWRSGKIPSDSNDDDQIASAQEEDPSKRARLERILDLLDSNMWLELDQVSISHLFGSGIDKDLNSTALVRSAESLARKHCCIFQIDSNRGLARFSRA